MVLLALALAWLFGLRPWARIEISWSSLALGLAGTVPLAAALLAVPAGRWRWLDELTGLVRGFLELLFRNAPPGAVLLVSVLAGVGEELLFRGVVQDGLAASSSPTVGILVASLLFGAAHAVSLPYLAVATVMGLYLGVLYHWSGNLLVPILVHALYDWIAIRYYLRRR
ncbi:MAG: CPBP family intramembrane glutamic endopeptidase [Wenzhouxiangella sp.]|nr:CPBP family intramembrane glutamic endopeptidase [Wenzhouxiangella sp.]